MAALCPGVQYGLSSQENFSGNSELIFVKLTDSASRAIEDYIKNQTKYNHSNQSPTITFLGNEGHLSFPSSHNGCSTFNFSISNTADMEGPGGSFECMQQLSSSRGSLDGLGAIPHKMRIHANDDVYEATRHRMTVAEENHKNKCTREIKPNQNDIGRKVKVKQTSNRSALIHPNRKELPVPRDISSKLPFQSNLLNKPTVTHSYSNSSNGLGNSQINNARLQTKLSDIARKPLKERLIHLLALRPFKKLELCERLKREGLREKISISPILKQISRLQDNAYHLNRVMWNEVREDWPFYTDTERQMLKRRKPQNLTPPGSSDGGSSGSGQSPTSTHPGSPPPISLSKRPGYFDGADGLPTKRQRISHYRKPSDQIYRSPVENISQRRPVTDSRDASNMNPRSRERESTLNDYTAPVNSDFSNGMLAKHNISDDEEIINHQNRSCDSHNLSFDVNREKTLPNDLSPCKDSYGKDDLRDRTSGDVMNNDRLRYEGVMNGRSKLSDGQSNSRSTYKENLSNIRVKRESKDQNRWNSLSNINGSPNSQNEPPINKDDTGMFRKNEGGEHYPDYLSEYTTIKDNKQRKKYKSEFNALYAEYKELYAAVINVSKYFMGLEEKLNKEHNSTPKYKDIKQEIYRAYKENKKTSKRKRFIYLHDKLSHIKRLVSEYDEAEGNVSDRH